MNDFRAVQYQSASAYLDYHGGVSFEKPARGSRWPDQRWVAKCMGTEIARAETLVDCTLEAAVKLGWSLALAGACQMDAPDGPRCWCGRPSEYQSGECAYHGRESLAFQKSLIDVEKAAYEKAAQMCEVSISHNTGEGAEDRQYILRNLAAHLRLL